MPDFASDAPVSPGRYLWIGPALALGLYTGRLLAELSRPGLLGAIALTLLTIIGAMLLLRRLSIWRTWPLLILTIYVLLSEPDLKIAASIGLATIIALLQTIKLPLGRLSLSERTLDILAATALVAVFVLLYVSTLARDVLPADAGELQLVAAKWGVAHPTGFPLYTILANLATRLPIGPSAAYRTNLLSALTSTLTLLLVYLTVYRLCGVRSAGLLAALALGTSTTFWSQATTANVRSLTALFTTATLYLFLILREWQPNDDTRSPATSPADGQKMRKRRLDLLWRQALFVIVLVSAVAHHASLVFIGSVFALAAIIVQPAFLRERRGWPVMLLSGLIALLPMLYLPIRGAAGALGAPQDLNSLRGFINHALGLGFRGDLFFFDQISILWARLSVMLNVLTFQFPAFLLLIALLGLVLLFAKDRLLASVLAVSIVLHTLVSAVYRAPQTVEYLLPVYVFVAVSLGYAIGRLRTYQLTSDETILRPRLTQVIVVLLVTATVVIILVQMLQNYRSYRQLGQETSTRDYVQQVLEDAPPEAVVLADWHWATPLWYLQEVEGVRRDIEVEFVFPESGLYADTWANRIASELEGGRTVIATHFDQVAYSELPVPEPYQDAFIFRQKPLLELPEVFTMLQADLGPGLVAQGYRLISSEVEPGGEMVVELAWHAEEHPLAGRKLFAHLLGPDGRLYAGDDLVAEANMLGLTITQFRLTPLLQAFPGKYELVVGSYRESSTESSNAIALAEVEVLPAQSPPITDNQVYRQLVDFSDRRTLIGYDWDSTLPSRQRLYLHWSTADGYETETVDVDGNQYIVPDWYGPWGVEISQSSLALEQESSYVPFGQGLVWLGESHGERSPFVPGQRVRLTQRFAAAHPMLTDQVVSLRLVGYQEDGHSWDWWDLDDSVPAMGAIPTLKWITGSRVSHPVFPTLSANAKPQQEVEPLLLLYDAFTSRQLPILDERITQQAPWVPLGRVQVMPHS